MEGGIYISTNFGENWTSANTGLPYDSSNFGYPIIKCFAISDSNIFTGTSGDYMLHDGICLSTNNGRNSINLKSNLYPNTIVIIGVNIFVGEETGNIYLSTDNEKNWEIKDNGLYEP